MVNSQLYQWSFLRPHPQRGKGSDVHPSVFWGQITWQFWIAMPIRFTPCDFSRDRMLIKYCMCMRANDNALPWQIKTLPCQSHNILHPASPKNHPDPFSHRGWGLGMTTTPPAYSFKCIYEFKTTKMEASYMARAYFLCYTGSKEVSSSSGTNRPACNLLWVRPHKI